MRMITSDHKHQSSNSQVIKQNPKKFYINKFHYFPQTSDSVSSELRCRYIYKLNHTHQKPGNTVVYGGV